MGWLGYADDLVRLNNRWFHKWILIYERNVEIYCDAMEVLAIEANYSE